MNDRVVDVLVHIVNEIKAKKGCVDNMDSIVRDLVDKGYTESEISTALSWLSERVKVDGDVGIHFDSTFRILDESERAMITPQAFGYIIQLRELGLINLSKMEEIIEKSMAIGTKPITTEEIKLIAASLMFNYEDSEFKIDSCFYVEGQHKIIH